MNLNKSLIILILSLILLILILILILIIYKNKESLIGSQKIWAMSFGGGGSDYHDAVLRISNELQQINIFNEIEILTDDDLKKDTDFWIKHKDFINNNKRGYGYWIWKPYLILKTLEKMNDDDILIYLDSGCEIVNNEKSYSKILEFVNKCNDNEILYTLAGHDEKMYTKMDLFEYMTIEQPIMNSGQHAATIIIVKKTNEMIKFITEWYNISCDYHLIDDSKSLVSNDASFIEHRHDQSVFSLLTKSDKYKNITNIDNNKIYDSFPILMSRKRNG